MPRDGRRPYAAEIFPVAEVPAITPATQEPPTYEPFYSLRHAGRAGKSACYWMTRRRASNRPNDDGTDVYLSLVALAMRPMDPDANILSIRTTCTNRGLPARLPFGADDGDFELEGAASLKRIVTLRKPTQPIRPAAGKAAFWRLISHLSLNYLSLVEEGKEALQQILRLYDFGQSAYSQNVVESIRRISSRRQFARVSSENGITFARGQRIEIELDEDRFSGSGAFLFASVLERFLVLNATLNSFTQLVVTTPQRKGALCEWQPRAGRKLLI